MNDKHKCWNEYVSCIFHVLLVHSKKFSFWELSWLLHHFVEFWHINDWWFHWIVLFDVILGSGIVWQYKQYFSKKKKKNQSRRTWKMREKVNKVCFWTFKLKSHTRKPHWKFETHIFPPLLEPWGTSSLSNRKREISLTKISA